MGPPAKSTRASTPELTLSAKADSPNVAANPAQVASDLRASRHAVSTALARKDAADASASTQVPPTPTRSPSRLIALAKASNASRTVLPVKSSPDAYFICALRPAKATELSACNSEARGSLQESIRRTMASRENVGMNLPVLDSHSRRNNSTYSSEGLESTPKYDILAPTDIVPHSTTSLSQEGSLGDSAAAPSVFFKASTAASHRRSAHRVVAARRASEADKSNGLLVAVTILDMMRFR
mmetsp:Transcript_22135/g.63482  ORF Transcript_22135/g.63482 Transcript_22135/m.63482 type:complete len:240 (+) Transcript_22135:605-1324(+)